MRRVWPRRPSPTRARGRGHLVEDHPRRRRRGLPSRTRPRCSERTLALGGGVPGGRRARWARPVHARMRSGRKPCTRAGLEHVGRVDQHHEDGQLGPQLHLVPGAPRGRSNTRAPSGRPAPLEEVDARARCRGGRARTWRAPLRAGPAVGVGTRHLAVAVLAVFAAGSTPAERVVTPAGVGAIDMSTRPMSERSRGPPEVGLPLHLHRVRDVEALAGRRAERRAGSRRRPPSSRGGAAGAPGRVPARRPPGATSSSQSIALVGRHSGRDVIGAPGGHRRLVLDRVRA